MGSGAQLAGMVQEQRLGQALVRRCAVKHLRIMAYGSACMLMKSRGSSTQLVGPNYACMAAWV